MSGPSQATLVHVGLTPAPDQARIREWIAKHQQARVHATTLAIPALTDGEATDLARTLLGDTLHEQQLATVITTAAGRPGVLRELRRRARRQQPQVVP